MAWQECGFELGKSHDVHDDTRIVFRKMRRTALDQEIISDCILSKKQGFIAMLGTRQRANSTVPVRANGGKIEAMLQIIDIFNDFVFRPP